MGYSHRFSPCWCRPDSPTGICILAALGGLRLSRDGGGQPLPIDLPRRDGELYRDRGTPVAKIAISCYVHAQGPRLKRRTTDAS
jgi:hypothetical protein